MLYGPTRTRTEVARQRTTKTTTTVTNCRVLDRVASQQNPSQESGSQSAPPHPTRSSHARLGFLSISLLPPPPSTPSSTRILPARRPSLPALASTCQRAEVPQGQGPSMSQRLPSLNGSTSAYHSPAPPAAGVLGPGSSSSNSPSNSPYAYPSHRMQPPSRNSSPYRDSSARFSSFPTSHGYPSPRSSALARDTSAALYAPQTPSRPASPALPPLSRERSRASDPRDELDPYRCKRLRREEGNAGSPLVREYAAFPEETDRHHRLALADMIKDSISPEPADGSARFRTYDEEPRKSE